MEERAERAEIATAARKYTQKQGITLDAGKRYTQTVEQSFHLSMAALGFQNSSAQPVTIMVEVDKAQFALCTLKPGSIPQQALDYTFTEGEEITFFTEGQGEVHLTGYLIEEVEPVDFEGENGLSESEDESQSAASDNLSSGEEVTLQDLLVAGNEDEDEQASDDDDDWDPSKSNPTSTKKKKAKEKKKTKRKGFRNGKAFEGGTASKVLVDLFNNCSSEDDDDGDDDDDWNPDEEDGGDESSKKTKKGKKRKAKKAKLDQDMNDTNVEGELSTVGKTDSQDERPKKKKAKKSMDNTTLSPSDDINVNENKRTVQEDVPNDVPSDSANTSQNMQSPNKDKRLSKDTESKSDGSQQDKSPSVSPTKKASAQSLKKILAGGVVIEDLKKGTGRAAKNGQKVALLYRGVLAKNSKQFDANLNRKSPFTFVLGKGSVIRGWDLGVAGMQVGGKRKLTIPPSQGYGNKQTGNIPPQSTLVFEVELVSMK